MFERVNGSGEVLRQNPLEAIDEIAFITLRLKSLDRVNYQIGINGHGNLLAPGESMKLIPKDDTIYVASLWYEGYDGVWYNTSAEGLEFSKELPLVADSVRIKVDGRHHLPIELASKTGNGIDEYRFPLDFEQYIELFDKEIVHI